MNSSDIRRSFLDFFKSKNHTEVPSSSLVPADDPTLLFTNAGMVQFKRVFQGLEHRDYRTATTSQKCVRAGGKHNDLEEVGHTTRHHTFFEMLGNFSFGDYFKKEAIEYAWEWVTSSEYLGLERERLYFTVHHTDEQAAAIWRDVTGVSDERIFRLGDKDNFWQMGDTGPCGPCSEIFLDLRGRGNGEAGRGAVPRIPGSVEEFDELSESGQLLEFWNLVFMQFDQAPDGSRSPLPAPSVDTGAGLERIASLMQHEDSNFHTDAFIPIIARAEEVIGKLYDRGPAGASFRVLADHARSIAFLLADGVYPSNDGRGYVLRRILRRGVRHAYLLGRTEPTLVHLCESVVQEMGGVYPELKEKASHIAGVTRAEEDRFLETIEDGLKRMDEITASGSGTVSGKDAFKLYDTYGFPIDLTEIVARDRGWSVDVAGFEEALREQQERSRSARKGSASGAPAVHTGDKGEFVEVRPGAGQVFVGYDTTSAETEVLAFRKGQGRLDLILEDNPFYAESGGQVSDTGAVEGQGWKLPVSEVAKEGEATVVSGEYHGDFEPTTVVAAVDETRRHDIERNHSATHLAHAALRHVLGDHVRQAGSVVDPDRLRFDFSHQAPVTDDQLADVEAIVNEGVLQNVELDIYEMPYREALEKGAMALFGEKYGDLVRVVDMPDLSVELCGGTHVRSTGQIGSFHFYSESGVAAGVRRIEAVTGRNAYARMKEIESRLRDLSDTLHTAPEHVGGKVEALLEERRSLEKRIEDMLRSGGGAAAQTEKHSIGPVTLEIAAADVNDRKQAGILVDGFRERAKESVLVIFGGGDRPGIHVGVTDDLISRGVKAGSIVSRIAELCGGKGGGRPHFASAGVGDPTKLPFTRTRVLGLVAEELGMRVDE